MVNITKRSPNTVRTAVAAYQPAGKQQRVTPGGVILALALLAGDAGRCACTVISTGTDADIEVNLRRNQNAAGREGHQ